MKKIIALLTAALVTVSVFAQNLPAFTEAEKAYVFDAKQLKEDYDDYCKIVNLSTENNLSFDVYVMKSNKKEWLFAGSATVNGVLDSVTLESEYEGHYERYRYFAIVPKDGRDYKVRFTWDEIDMYVVEHHYCAFLVNPVADVPANVRDNSTIIDVNSIKGKFKDNIKLINKSKDSNMDFVIFGFNNADDTVWEAVGKSHLKEADDTDFIETPLHDQDADLFNFYAVYCTSGKKYDVNATKSHSDLYIEIK